MERLNNILEICNEFKDGNYSIEEFQSRLGTALLPEPETEIGKKIGLLVFDTMEELENARFVYGYDWAYEITNRLIDAIQSC